MYEIRSKIKDLREANGLTQEEFAAKLGYKTAKVQNIEGGKQNVDHLFLRQISVQFTIDMNQLFDENASSQGMENPTFIQIPRYSVEASAGHGAGPQPEDETGSYGFKREWIERRGLNANNLSVISVSGDSMEPNLCSGDLILINHADSTPQDGNIYAVQFSEGLYVKRIQHLPEGRLHLISANKGYPPIEIKHPEADGMQVVGRVVASMHEW